MGPSVIPCMMGTAAISAPTPTPAATAPTPDNAASNGTPPTSSSLSAANKAPRAAGPKIAFPSSHLAELYNLIHGNTKIQTDLVSQLRQHFESVSSKAAIEAKIREVAFREGKTKDSKWKVKSEAWVAAGLAPPIEDPTPAPAPAAPTASIPTTVTQTPLTFFTKQSDSSNPTSST